MSKLITLTQGYKAIVDDEDYEYLNQFNWNARVVSGTQYAKRNIIIGDKKTTINMHREIMNCPINLMVDHINGNGLDNRKKNLRICTRSQNLMNSKKPMNGKTSKYKGVCFNVQNNRWRAEIRLNKKPIFLGYFLLESEAALAYNRKALEIFGSFAKINEV